MWVLYFIIALLLFVLELVFFRIANQFSIIDKPNERSSHTKVVPRGGGVLFVLSMLAWVVMMLLQGEGAMLVGYLPFLGGLLLIVVVSFWDDVRSLPDSVRLVAQFAATGLMLWSLGILHWEMWWVVILALIVAVGATNIINFMDGINGITAGYALAVLGPLWLLNRGFRGPSVPSTGSGTELVPAADMGTVGFIEESYLVVAILGVLVFCYFNFRPKGRAKCFAGDVGSVGMAFIMLFAIGRLIVQTGDVTYLILLLVYGVDGGLTIVHRIMLHEHVGRAHRKHAYQIMANELNMGHLEVTWLYMALQLVVSLGFIYLCPNTVQAHWIYLIAAVVVLSLAYVLFMKKFYHLHEEYLKSLEDSGSSPE